MSHGEPAHTMMETAPRGPERNEPRRITGEELARMGDLGPCELVAGRIVPMSHNVWKHGELVSTVSTVLNAFIEEHKPGTMLTGAVGIYTQRDPDSVRGADVAFISTERLAKVASESFLDAAPELVVEVVSPGNTWQEMRQKIDEYFAIGVERVWIVEPARRQVLVYRAPTDLSAIDEADRLEGEGLLRGFCLSLSALFA